MTDFHDAHITISPVRFKLALSTRPMARNVEANVAFTPAESVGPLSG
ncbi:MAG: hypothetical protein ABIK86_07360 [candidate division WOR-3 bacterium]